MMLVTHLVDNVVEDDKYDNGNRYHNDRLHPDLEVLRLLAVDLRLEAALLVADMPPMFLNISMFDFDVHLYINIQFIALLVQTNDQI